jgi:hypothetical protein
MRAKVSRYADSYKYNEKVKKKQSLYTPWRHLGGEEV